MSDKEDTTPPPKSIPDLRAISTGNILPLPTPDTKVKKDKGPKTKDLHHTVVQAMCGKTHGWPAFPSKLHKVVDECGETIVYVEKDGIVSYQAPIAVETLIADYWQVVLQSGPRPIFLGALSADDTTKIRKLWLVTAPARRNDFPLVVWQSDPRPAHHRLAFDPLPIDQLANAAPLFAELMARTSNAAGLMAFLGSLLDDRSQRQQYVWMYGEGGNGKGALVRALTSVLGKVVASEQAPGPGDKHWTSGLIGKRLVYFPDCNNASFVTSGLFKSLSGEDKIRVEIKRGAILSLDMPLKFLLVSNKKPNLSSQKSDMRRVIYCSVGPVGRDEERYEERLKAEVPAILSACWWSYLAETGGNPRALYPIENMAEVQELAADAEHEYEAFVDQYIGFCDNDPSKPDYLKPYVPAGALKAAMMQAGFKDHYERRLLRSYLEQKHQLKDKIVKFPATVTEKESVKRVFLNIKIFNRY